MFNDNTYYSPSKHLLLVQDSYLLSGIIISAFLVTCLHVLLIQSIFIDAYFWSSELNIALSISKFLTGSIIVTAFSSSFRFKLLGLIDDNPMLSLCSMISSYPRFLSLYFDQHSFFLTFYSVILVFLYWFDCWCLYYYYFFLLFCLISFSWYICYIS